jgi:hypothetical protein
MRRQQTAHTVASPVPNGMATSPAPTSAAPEVSAGAATDDDPDLAAYNARLADLAAKGPKTWRHREEVVVRRPQ